MKKLFSKLMLVAMAAATFTACEDVPEPYPIPEDKPEPAFNYTGAGTVESPYTCADAIHYAQSLDGEESENTVYIKGIVSEVTEEFTTNFGNGTFKMSDDGLAANEFTAYRVLYLGNKKYSSGKDQVKKGDEVIVCGRVVNFRGNTPETVQGSGFLYSLNGVTEGGGGSDTPGEATGDGTLENPFNYAAAIAYAKEVGETESPKDVYIKGKVASITEEYTTQYGNGTFTINDDGSDGSSFTVFRALYLGNKKFANGDTQIKKGDDVIVCGKVTNYRGNTPETVQAKAYLYSLNGNTGSGDTPQPGGEAKGSGTLEDPYNAAAANAYASSLAADAKSDNDVYIKGKIIDIEDKNQFNTQYGNCTFYISDDGTDSGEKFYVFRTLYLGNVKYTEGELPKKGDEVIICGKVMNYKGNTPETAANESYIYSLNGKTEAGSGGGGGNDTPGEAKGTGTLEDPFNAAAANAFASALAADTESDKDIYIKGKIIDIEEKNQFNAQYGNCTFYISDDGTDTSDKFYVFRTLYLGNVKYTEGELPKKGDEVIICGKVVNYKGNTPETAANKSYIYSLNGKTEAGTGGGGGGDNPGGGGDNPGGGGDDTGDGYAITLADFGLENATDVPTLTAGDGTTLTFAQEGGKNAPKYYTAAGGSVRMYALNSLTIKSSKTITKVVITTSDPYQGTAYNGNDQMYGEAGGNKVETKKDSDTQVTFSKFSDTSLKIVNDFTGNSGGTQLRVAKITITYAK